MGLKTIEAGMSARMQNVLVQAAHEVEHPDTITASSTVKEARTRAMAVIPDREATASIRGYHYQFDATIIAVLALKE
jgi:hypothetical protein